MDSPPLTLKDVLDENKRLSRFIEVLKQEHAQQSAAQASSLRDHFAGQALVGQIAYEGAEGCGGDRGSENVAEWCYELADAMLKARGVK